jgi:two-component system chemotaxis sensor kinase CheA
VEGIADTEEIVVKPLGKQLRGIKAFAGATIMGDGKVALILDVLGLAQNARVVSEVRDRSLTDIKAADTKQTVKSQNLLVFSVGDRGRMAILLDMVGRLEEFDRASIESSGDQDVVQYRGEIMPLIYLSKVFHTESQPQLDQSLQAVVYAEKGKSVGLVVDQILDIVDEVVTIKKSSNRPGVLGSAVIKQRVTDLVDVREIIRAEIPNFYDQQVLALEGRS